MDNITMEQFGENIAEAILKRQAEEQEKQDIQDAELFKACADGWRRRLEEATQKAKADAERQCEEELLRMVNGKTRAVQQNHIKMEQQGQEIKKKQKRRKRLHLIYTYQYGSVSSWVIAGLLLIALVMKIFGMI